MKRSKAIILFAAALVLSHLALIPALCLAADYYLHTTTSDAIDNNPPTATTAKFKDSPAVKRTSYQEIGIWSAAPLIAPMQLESLASLVIWIGLKNSDDQGTYFDLRVEIWKNRVAIAAGETKNIRGVTRNPAKAKQVEVPFGAITGSQFNSGDILSIRILTKVADRGGHNNAVGLRLYYDAVSRPSWLGATFGALPTKLVVASVNSGANPSAGDAFSVTVQSQDASDTPANVSNETAVSLSLTAGTGTLGGTLAGVIAAGTNQLTFSGVTYTKAESGVVLTAARTSGDELTASDSAPFSVNPGVPARLAFSTQPGNSTVGSPLAGPPTVVIQDGFGNLTASTASITVALGTNPVGAILSGTTTNSAIAGVASFSDLSVNQAGTGYTLSASAAALTGATSDSFSITGSAGVSLAASPASLAAGNPLTVSWAQIPNPTQADWIGLYAPGSDENSYLSYIYVSCTTSPNVVAQSGSCPFPTSNYLAPGIYEFRLFTNNSYTRLATSNPVTVTAGLILTASPAAVPAGATVTVAWTNNPNPSSTDSIRLYGIGTGFVGAPLYVSCTQTPTVPLASGSCPYVMPASPVPGHYEFKLFTNDTNTVIATSNQVSVVPPSKLAVYIDQNATAGPPGFSLTVESQTTSGARANVLTDTTVSIGLKAGTGVLAGTLTGMIPAGSSQVTIGLATYTKAESGVVVTATRTSGDPLTTADSLPFTVSGGAPVTLVFVTQPGNATAGSTIPGPPTVAFRDVLGNVTSSTAAVALAIGTNPSAGTLSGHMTAVTSTSVAFAALSINQPGDGYTLTASADGLTSATSSPFSITSPAGGGVISGAITRVSNHSAISGALVEVYQGATLRGMAFSNDSGNYSIDTLGAGSYTVRASFTGLVPQVVSNVAVVDGNTTNVSLSLNFGIAVQTPVAAATITDFSVLVTGHFDRSLASEVAITVNDYVALIDGDEFAAFVPMDSQTTTLTATLKDSLGNLIAGDAVPITPQPPTSEPVLTFRPFPAIALASTPVRFTLVSRNEISQLQLDGNGDGTIDFAGTTLADVSVTFAEPGLYLPFVTVTDTAGALFTDSAIVQVLDITQMDAQLRAKWQGMKSALWNGNTNEAVSYIVSNKRVDYQNMFNNLAIPFASIDQMLGNITYQAVNGLEIEYEMLMNDGPDGDVSYLVLFSLDLDGVWRISFF